MKKNILLAAAAALTLSAQAQTYQYLTIEQQGKTVSIPIENISKVTFTTDDESTTEAEVPDAGYSIRVLTFEDAYYVGDGATWSELIDSPQYGGTMLYNDFETTDYSWYDHNNTELCSAITYPFWSGGEAISNYVNADYATTEVGYTEQLATPAGGYNGSENFCIHNGYFDGVYYTAPSGGIWFKDEVARVIDHMYVSMTSYQLSQAILGSDWTPAATETDWVKFVAIGTDASGQTKEVEITMMEDGKPVEGWVKWDLSDLGEIVRLDFNITSSMMNDWGLYFPGYIAYDNVAVRFP